MPDFKRENRYVVIKRKDLAQMEDKHGSLLPQITALAGLERMVTLYREQEGKKPLGCVVLESDWPEYEMVWKMIEGRCGEVTDNSPSVVQAFKMYQDRIDRLEQTIRGFLSCPRNPDEATIPAAGFDVEDEAHRKQVVYGVSVSHERFYQAEQVLLNRVGGKPIPPPTTESRYGGSTPPIKFDVT